LITVVIGVAALLARPGAVWAQAEVVARGVAEARRLGDEGALVHLAEEAGPAGLADCLARAGRSGRQLCAQAARYLELGWPALPALAGVLRDHDRQLASRAAESMMVILAATEPGDLGPQEALPEDAEALLAELRQAGTDARLSPDVRAQAVAISGAVARLAGSALDLPRDTLADPEIAVRRAAAGALLGSVEAADVAALAEAAARDADRLVAATAVAGVCEASLGAPEASPMPAPVDAEARELLGERGARPSLIAPLLACLARSTHPQAAPLRALAEQHPNPDVRAAWAALTDEDRPRGR
jgi:hypothetical protein